MNQTVPIFTSHAIKRWKERFHGMDMYKTYDMATKKIGSRIREKIAKRCPAHRSQWIGKRSVRGVYAIMTNEKIVFLIVPPEKVITVFDLRE